MSTETAIIITGVICLLCILGAYRIAVGLFPKDDPQRKSKITLVFLGILAGLLLLLSGGVLGI